MRQPQETTLALFIDFDNVAVGARDAGLRFDVQLLIQRLLEKGKIIVKKAYADWSHYKEYMADLHQAGIELIEIPWPKVSGKNSADIRLVVDALELCYAKAHLDTFVIDLDDHLDSLSWASTSASFVRVDIDAATRRAVFSAAPDSFGEGSIQLVLLTVGDAEIDERAGMVRF